MVRHMLMLLTLLLFTVPAFPEYQEAETIPESIEALREEIQKILDKENIPGASIALVAKDGTIWAGGVGKADLAAGKEVTDETLFRVGSISKSFTALSVLMLVEQGLVNLDSPVKDIVPEIAFTNPWAETHPVRVAHLLEHTTGFDDLHFRDYAYVDNPDITLLEGLAYCSNSRRSRWKPGMHMSYCNSGPAVAAYILEKVTGRTFEDFVQEHIFDVLGMEHSSFHHPEAAELMAKGYEEDGVTEANYDHIIVRPAGSLNTSSKEMARFIRMMINRGTMDEVRLIKAESMTRMETPQTTLAARAGFKLGYSLGNYPSFVNGFLFHGHNGGITGFVSSYAYSSELGLGYFVSINKPSSELEKIGNLIGRYLTKGIGKPNPPTVDLSENELQEVKGFYQLITPRLQIMHVVGRFFSIQNVSLKDGKLYVKPLIGGERQQLIPVTAKSFRFEDQPVASMFNVTDEDGNLIGQWGALGNNKKISGPWVVIQLGVAILAVLFMVSSVLFALVWTPLTISGRMKKVPYLRARVFPLLATLSLCIVIVPFVTSSELVSDLGNLTLMSLLVFCGTVLFAAFTMVSLYSSYRSFSMPMNGLVRAHSVLVTLACSTTLLYLLSCGVIGIRTWAC